MKLDEFWIGGEFSMGHHRWRCTDIGSRTVSAIRLDAPDESWYSGTPYAVAEYCLDEDDQEACNPA